MTEASRAEHLARRIEFVENLTALCDRKEARRKARDPVAPQQEEENPTARLNPDECGPKQCFFCLCDESRSYERRVREYARPAKMMDHVENDHLGAFAPDDEIACPHPSCATNGVILCGVGTLKNHFQRRHGVVLRDLTLRRSAR